MSNWIRELTCVVSGVIVTDLRIEFQVNKTMDKTNNDIQVNIYNLAETNRVRIQEELKGIELFGGYRDGTQGLLFTGSIKTVRNRLKGVDIVTEIFGTEAMLAHNYGFLNKTVAPANTKPFDIIRLLQKSMIGVEMGETIGVRGLDNKKKRPLTICGGTTSEMDKVCRDNRLHWSVQNGFLEVVAYEKAIEEVTIVSKQTGMVGSPELTELGVRVKTLLDHRIAPHRVIDVITVAEKAGGRFRVEKVTYQGNNMDGEYVCVVDASRMTGATVTKTPKDRTDIT